jgi:hypothetical protein
MRCCGIDTATLIRIKRLRQARRAGASSQAAAL